VTTSSRLTEIHPVAGQHLAVTLAGITFPTPVLAAPGPLGSGREAQAAVDLRAFGGFITKSVTLEPREGHPRPHVVDVDGGWLNAVGLRNPGLAAFLVKDLPCLRTLGIPIVVSVAGTTVEEFVRLAEWLDAEEGIAALELNVSCPNVHAGQRFGSDPRLTEELVAAVRRATRRPLLVKLTPNVTDVAAVARAAAGAGADAFGCVNTLAGLAIDPATRRPRLGAGFGGLSGPAIRPVAVRLTWEVARATGLPVIGMGGILTAEHALEFLLAGAHAVAVASAVLVDADAPRRITAGLVAYLAQHGFTDIRQVVGAVEGLPDDAAGLALAGEGWSG